MEKVAGFEIVEQFLDNWKAESVKWYAEQYEKYLADKEYRKSNPSKADQSGTEIFRRGKALTILSSSRSLSYLRRILSKVSSLLTVLPLAQG